MPTVNGPDEITTLTGGDDKVFFTDSDGNVQEVSIGATGTVLTSTGLTADPAFSALPADATVGANKAMYTNNSDVESGLAFGAAGTVLKSGGTDATATPPTFGAVTATDIAGGNWKVLYTDGSGNVTELALSATAGTVLTSNGAAIAPTFQTAGADFADENSVVSSEMFMDHPTTNPAAIAAGGSGYGQGVWTYMTSWYSY